MQKIKIHFSEDTLNEVTAYIQYDGSPNALYQLMQAFEKSSVCFRLGGDPFDGESSLFIEPNHYEEEPVIEIQNNDEMIILKQRYDAFGIPFLVKKSCGELWHFDGTNVRIIHGFEVV